MLSLPGFPQQLFRSHITRTLFLMFGLGVLLCQAENTLTIASLRAEEGTMVLLDFTSSHCPACQRVEPLLNELVRKNYPIRKVDPNNPQDRELYTRYGISTTPSYVMLLDGQEVGRYIGRGEGMSELKPILLGLFDRAVAQRNHTEPKTAEPDSRPSFVGATTNLSHSLSATAQQFLGGIDQATRDVSQVTRDAGEELAASTNDFSRDLSLAAQGTVQSLHQQVAQSLGFNAYDQPTPVPQFEGAPSVQGCEGGVCSLPQGQPSNQDGSANQNPLLGWSVRLRVEDNVGNQPVSDCGTGTIIHSNMNNGSVEGLVLTCGHLFREKQGQSKIQVDLFDDRGKVVSTVPGECVWFDDDLDIAFVGVPLPFQPKVAELVPPGYLPHKGDVVFSAGCTGGETPTIWEHRILTTDQKFHQPAQQGSNGESFYYIEVNNAPRQGRSGGGLFTRTPNGEYRLLGVCNAGDPQTNQGFFLPSSMVYRQLLSNKNLAFVYEDILKKQSEEKNSQQNEQLLASNAEKVSNAAFAVRNSEQGEHIQPVNSIQPSQQGETPSAQCQETTANDPFTASLQELKKMHQQGAEIICIINWPKGKGPEDSEVIRLPKE